MPSLQRSDGKDQTNLTLEGMNPALQTIRVRNTALKDTLLDAALPSTTGTLPWAGHGSETAEIPASRAGGWRSWPQQEAPDMMTGSNFW
ncbi:DNA repair protein RAD51 2 [Grus japonensis]|uniref:DNA repair protein RAD51 2 n=1 Tax=Grus japonensis TaxID=30415 RepID=A0ABC9WYK3_GRUJA